MAQVAIHNMNGLAIVASCSGAVVKKMNSLPKDQVLVVTNGHCLDMKSLLSRESYYLKPGEIISNIKANQIKEAPVISIFSATKTHLVELSEIVFATMTGTDVSVLKLNITYKELMDKYQITPKLFNANIDLQNVNIQVHASYYNRMQNCKIINRVNLKEGEYSTHKALKFSSECSIYNGYSGSAVLVDNQIVGLANTHFSGNDKLCSLNNPCEISTDGVTLPNQIGQSYGVSLSILEKL